MIKTISIVKHGEEEIKADDFKERYRTELIFKELQKDTIGKSGSSPTWGYVYSNENEKVNFQGIALHKEYDYDYPMAAYSEKIASILGKELLNSSVRVPAVDVVEPSPGFPETISYRVMDNDKEDMIHIRDTIFNKFTRENIKNKKDIFALDELLECIKLQINDEENYKQIEKDIIQVILLDAIINNGDRHALNWAIVRNKENGKYNLAIFDHSSSFVNMFEERSYHLTDGWSSSYITVGNDRGKNNIGSTGKVIVDYISKEYPEYFCDFYEKLNLRLPQILEKIKQENFKIDFYRFSKKMDEKSRYLKRLKDRGELEYE